MPSRCTGPKQRLNGQSGIKTRLNSLFVSLLCVQFQSLSVNHSYGLCLRQLLFQTGLMNWGSSLRKYRTCDIFQMYWGMAKSDIYQPSPGRQSRPASRTEKTCLCEMQLEGKLTKCSWFSWVSLLLWA